MARVDSTGGAGYVIDNGTGAAVRTKLNQITAALNSTNSGSGDPAITSAYQQHIDTASGLWKIRNGANNAYISLGDITAADLGHVKASAPTMTGDVTCSSVGFLKVPVGTNAQQPGQSSQPAAAVGQFRYNSTTHKFEGYAGASPSWGEIGGGGGATGGDSGANAVFWENELTVTHDYSITAARGAGSFGDVTIAAGKTVTIPSDSSWTIV